jgi:hypothetical protein
MVLACGQRDLHFPLQVRNFFVVHSALGKYRDLNLDYERGKMQIAAQ